MWFLLILSIVNSAFDQQGFVLKHRVYIAGLPINIIDGLMIIGLLGVLVAPVLTQRRRADRRHPLFTALLVLFTLATVAGVFGWMTNGAFVYEFSVDFRNFTAFAFAIVLGRHYLKEPASCRRFAYVHVLAGVLCAGLILMFFIGTGSERGLGRQIESVRAIQYVSVYAGLAAVFLFYTLLDRPSRVLPLAVSVIVMGFCFVGQFATLSRSDWLACLVGMGSVLFLLPREGRAFKIFGFALAVPVLGIFLLIGVMYAAPMVAPDLGKRMTDRLLTMMPVERGDNQSTRGKAWDTRLPGIKREVELWLESPIIGHGFGQSSLHVHEQLYGVSFNHCAWTAALATLGVLGFAAYAAAIVGMTVVGRRLVRDGVDRGYVLVGVIAFTAGMYNIVYGVATMSWNTQRQALLLGLLCGLTLKAREMQLTTARELAYAGQFDDGSGAGGDLAYASTGLDPSLADEYERGGHFA